MEQAVNAVFSFIRLCDNTLGDTPYDWGEKFNDKEMIIDLTICDFTRPIDCTGPVVVGAFQKAFTTSKVKEIPDPGYVHVRITRPWR